MDVFQSYARDFLGKMSSLLRFVPVSHYSLNWKFLAEKVCPFYQNKLSLHLPAILRRACTKSFACSFISFKTTPLKEQLTQFLLHLIFLCYKLHHRSVGLHKWFSYDATKLSICHRFVQILFDWTDAVKQSMKKRTSTKLIYPQTSMYPFNAVSTKLFILYR